MNELIRKASLASSTRNTKPWKFEIKVEKIILRPDFTRWLKVEDPDKRQFFMSVGCALENLLIAARQQGWQTEQEWDLESEDPRIIIKFIAKK